MPADQELRVAREVKLGRLLLPQDRVAPEVERLLPGEGATAQEIGTFPFAHPKIVAEGGEEERGQIRSVHLEFTGQHLGQPR